MAKSFYTSVERRGNNILWRGYENGKRVSRKETFSPTFYIPNNETGRYRSFLNKDMRLAPRNFDTMREARDFVNEYKGVEGIQIHGTTNYISQFIQERFPGEIDFDPTKVNIASFDIEVNTLDGFPNVGTADKDITSVSYKSSRSNTYHLLGMKGYDKEQTITGIPPEDILFMEFDTEQALLRRFIQIWTNDYPDIVTGWHVEYFDIQYLLTRIRNILGEKAFLSLSPWNIIEQTSRKIFNKEKFTYKIFGISVIDYLDTFKKFGYKYGPQESYKLDHIAHSVLGEKKLDYTQYDSLAQLWEENPQLYLDYNLQDTRLVQRLEDEAALIQLVMTMAYSSGVNYKETFGTVGIWETIIYRRLMEKNLVAPIKSGRGIREGDLVGGYVKDPKPGMYPWVVSFDLSSLYPHLMLQYNMSPETFVHGRKEDISIEMVLSDKYKNTDESVSICANGACFRNDDQGFISSIIDEYYQARSKIKKEMLVVEQKIETELDDKLKHDLERKSVQLHNRQMAIKIQLNSLYGATANVHFQYYIHEMAEAITTSGQLSIRYAEKSVNEYLNKALKTDVDYVIYCDTDSIFVDMSPVVEKAFGSIDITNETAEKFIDKVVKSKVEPAIERGYEKLHHSVGSYRQAMSMKREKITNKMLFVAKKRYIASVLNNEGVHYEKPKISVTGLESVRSSTPAICRRKLEEAFSVILNTNEETTQKFIADFRREFGKLRPEEMAKTSGTDDIEKFMDRKSLYRKGTPIHVRGAILYNHWLEQKGLTKRYERIQSGDKIKFLYLKLPNPIHENIIAFPGFLPEELDLNRFIDTELQFEKVFMSPIEHILDAIGWTKEPETTLEDLFG